MNNTSEKKTEAKHLPNSELLQSQTNAQEKENKESLNSDEIIQREKVEGTPFTIIKLDNKGWFLTLGRYRMSEVTDNKQELIDKVTNKDWTLILDTIVTLITSDDL